mgnify:CR=1 FL=1
MVAWRTEEQSGANRRGESLSTFLGSYRFKVSAKGRLSIPAPIRDGLAAGADGTFVILPGPEGCLEAYPLDEWMRRVKFLKSIPNRKKARIYKRKLLTNAVSCKMDAQHRIIIPVELLRWAGIEDEVLIVGQLERLELWNPSTYEKQDAENDIPIEDILEEIEDLLEDRRHESGGD